MRIKYFLLLIGIGLVSIVLGIWMRRNFQYINTTPEDNTNREIKRLKLRLRESEEENNSWFGFYKPSNCTNCGAGLSSRICEYCNTKY